MYMLLYSINNAILKILIGTQNNHRPTQTILWYIGNDTTNIRDNVFLEKLLQPTKLRNNNINRYSVS